MNRLFVAVFVSAAALTPLAYADKGYGSHGGASRAAPAQAGEMAQGEVRRVDKDAKKITIRHGPMPKLDMPAMTMVFQVKDPGMLEKVKAGDRVRFDAEKVGGAFMVTAIEPVH